MILGKSDSNFIVPGEEINIRRYIFSLFASSIACLREFLPLSANDVTFISSDSI